MPAKADRERAPRRVAVDLNVYEDPSRSGAGPVSSGRGSLTSVRYSHRAPPSLSDGATALASRFALGFEPAMTCAARPKRLVEDRPLALPLAGPQAYADKMKRISAYFRPESIGEAFALLDGPGAVLIGGGTKLDGRLSYARTGGA